jgi:hypothetical protein
MMNNIMNSKFMNSLFGSRVCRRISLYIAIGLFVASIGILLVGRGWV